MKRKLLMLGVAAMAVMSTAVLAQQAGYPIIVTAPGKGPFNFPEGYKTDFSKVTMSVKEKLAPNLYVVHGSSGPDTAHPDGSGGRTAVLFGPDGVLMVDTQNRQVTDKTLAAIRTFTKAPIKIVINSHAHSDHTGGNAFFAKQGAVIIGQQNLAYELTPGPDARPEQKADFDPIALPKVTYNYDPKEPGKPALTIHMNGETVDAIPMMPSHLGGDTVIRFRNANVIYIEDFYRNFGYPYADQANGGSIQGMLDAIDLFMKLSNDKTILVPGHGHLIHKAELLPYRKMIVEVRDKVTQLKKSGKSLKDVLAMDLTKPYDTGTDGDTKQSKDRFISEVYAETNGVTLPPIVEGRRKMPKYD